MSQNTKQKILDTAAKSFLDNGYNGTVIDSVVAKAGVSKGTVFYHFKNKEGLACAVIEQYYEDFQDKLRQFKIDPNPMQTIDNYLNNLVSQLLHEEGIAIKSLLGMMTQEIPAELVELNELIANKYEHWTHSVQRLLDGVFKKQDTVNTQALAHKLISLIEGGMILLQASSTKSNVLLMNIKSYQHYLQLLTNFRYATE